MRLEMIVIKGHTISETSDKVSAEYTTFVLCVKNDSERKLLKAPTSNKGHNVESEISETLAHEILFEVLPTVIGFFLSL